MVHICRTTQKSIGSHHTLGHLAPHVTPRQLEESAKPQKKEPAETEEDAIHSQGDSNDLSDYTPLSDLADLDSELEPVRAAIQFRSYSEESSTVPMHLHGLLFQLGITWALEYRVKGVPRPLAHGVHLHRGGL
jgi:hypothetical protein